MTDVFAAYISKFLTLLSYMGITRNTVKDACKIKKHKPRKRKVLSKKNETS